MACHGSHHGKRHRWPHPIYLYSPVHFHPPSERTYNFRSRNSFSCGLRISAPTPFSKRLLLPHPSRSVAKLSRTVPYARVFCHPSSPLVASQVSVLSIRSRRSRRWREPRHLVCLGRESPLFSAVTRWHTFKTRPVKGNSIIRKSKSHQCQESRPQFVLLHRKGNDFFRICTQ